MPPSATKVNYRTYEAQARMIRAIVAAHPEVKWNYKGTCTKTLIFFFSFVLHFLVHLLKYATNCHVQLLHSFLN